MLFDEVRQGAAGHSQVAGGLVHAYRDLNLD
jgi:hypothetical protein